MTTLDRHRERIDWSQLWYPGPARPFTDEELARAGHDRPSPTLLMVLAVNLLACVVAGLQLLPAPAVPWVGITLMAALYPVYRAAMWLWRRPTRGRLLGVSMVCAFGLVALAYAARPWLPDPDLRRWVGGAISLVAMASSLAFWALTVFRAHQIEARLRELAEREQAIDMARQLASAQIQPHFLFNTLASLQHWVASGDARAAPLLASLTAYLRATLPLFQHRLLSLGEELEAAQRYLEVMQARLGERLRFTLEADGLARTQRLPPGLLLTLVENAVEHGVQPSLQGAEIAVRAWREGEHTLVEVRDSGAGLALPLQEGLGLANSRARLAQAWGDAAALSLEPQAGGGTCARLRLPLQTLSADRP
ncbi:sensor histidine kinase [Aquabacterium sp.]|uniref:sensor histidine kinase n=1 Tax=Aquabacterium sp. TaxID=1872578 RepID=UPI0037849E3A